MYTINVLFVLLPLCGVWAGDRVNVVQAILGASLSLPCRAQAKAGVQYMYVSWYKMQLHGDPPTPRRRGLVLRDLPEGVAEHYAGLTREVVLDNDTSDILLPNVTCGDAGEYVCSLQAPVGERIQRGMVVLKLSDCNDIPVGNVDNPVGNLRMNVEINILISAGLTLVLVFLVVYCCLRKLRHDQKKAWQADVASLQATLWSQDVIPFRGPSSSSPP
ncbi:CD83 antigen [Phyllopteryx taeniolatus]|uniref:CD83 antigen n=1 Tax=Phyllopteryx taeniolatus TaxID=161469 RepID=UPI002AD2B08E|nr:CD83 antigen [Phyllopteryx taeniolatus]XP_061631497.1 CD83 antigen [Phyllopteryx taeniolatus]